MTVPDTETQKIPLLADAEIVALNCARDILDDLEKRADELVHDLGPWMAGNHGRLSECCHTAEWAIFQVLNCGSSRCDMELTADQLHNH